jgi:Tol biopolymer transport system component
MAGTRTWTVGVVAAALMLPGAASVAAAPGSAGAAVVAALPVPVASAPRVGFVDETDELRLTRLVWEAPIVEGPGTGGGPIVEGPGTGGGPVVGVPGGGGGPIIVAPGGGGLVGGGTVTGGTSLTNGPGAPLVALAADDFPPVFDDPTPEEEPAVGGHDHDGEATAHAVTRGSEDDDTVASNLAWVSTEARDDPTAPDDPGEIYYRDDQRGTGPDDLRATCDPATESHPTVSPDGTRIAYATNAHGTWDIAVIPIPTSGECPTPEPTWVTHGEGDSTWPTWLDDDTLVFSSTRDDDLGELYRAETDGTAVERLTTMPDIADTQPDARATTTGWLVAFTTTRYLVDGSVGYLALDASGKPDGNLGPEGIRDPYAAGTDPDARRLQGTEPAWSLSGSPWALAFTSTENDASGDIWVAAWAADAREVLGERPVADGYRRAESHATWLYYASTANLQTAALVYTSEVVTADVSDAVADDGTAIREISRSGVPLAEENQAGVDYSPDGEYVVTSVVVGSEEGGTGWELQVARADTLEVVDFEYLRNSRDIDLNPQWSPDGSTIAFVRRPWDGEGYQPPQIRTVDAADPTTDDQHAGRLITPQPDADPSADLDPSWFPDSRRLAFSRASEDTDAVDQRSIWTVDTGSLQSDPLQLCRTATCTDDLVLHGGAPAVSPDGTTIALASPWLREGTLTVSIPGNVGSVRIRNTPAGPRLVSDELVPLTFDSQAVIATSDQPDWSPDGTEIAFTGSRVGRPRSFGIYAVAPDGSAIREVVDGPGPQRQPAYQPFTDLVLTLTTAAATPPSADGATITATVTNSGPAPVRTATVSVEVPPGLSTPGAPGCAQSAAVLTCPVVGPLALDDTAAFVIPVVGVTDTTVVTVTGVVETRTPEREVTNNSASVDLGGGRDPGVAGGAGVTVSIEDPGIVWTGGRPLRATFTVRNAGTQPVQAVRLTTGFGAPLVPVPAGGQPCLDASGACELGTLASGAATVLVATVEPPGPPPLPALSPPTPALTAAVTGTVTTTSPDPTTADDTASATIEVRHPSVVVTPTTARPGEVVFAVGTDFPPGAPANLSWSQGLMSVGRSPAADRTGTWSQPIVILRGTQLNTRLLQVEDHDLAPTYGAAHAGLLVVPPSVDGPTFLFRR